MGQAVVGVSNRADQSRSCAQVRRDLRPGSAISNCLTISHECQAGCRLLLVEDLVEEDDLSRDLVAAERLQLVKAAYYDDVGDDSVRRCRRASAKRGEHDFLR